VLVSAKIDSRAEHTIATQSSLIFKFMSRILLLPIPTPFLRTNTSVIVTPSARHERFSCRKRRYTVHMSRMKEPDISNDAVMRSNENHNSPNSPPRAAQESSISNSTLLPSSAECAVQEPEAPSITNIYKNVSDVSLEAVDEGLTSISNAPSPTNTKYTVPTQWVPTGDHIDDNASDVSLEPIEGGLNSLFRKSSKSKTKSKSKAKSKKMKNKKLSSPATGNALYAMLKGMAAGKPAPPVQPGDESLLAWTSGLLASISVTGNTPTTPDPANIDVDESLVNYASNLLASISVDTGADSVAKDKDQTQDTSNDKKSISAHLWRIIGGFATQTNKSKFSFKNKASKKPPQFGKANWMKKTQEDASKDVDDMDDDELLRYAMEQSMADLATKESLLDLEGQNSGHMDEAMMNSSNDPPAENEEKISAKDGMDATSTRVLSGLPNINALPRSEMSQYSAFTKDHATSDSSRATKVTSESSENTKTVDISNELHDKEGSSTVKTTPNKMEIDASTPALKETSLLGVKEGIETSPTTRTNALLLQKNAQAALSLALEDELTTAMMASITSASASASSHATTCHIQVAALSLTSPPASSSSSTTILSSPPISPVPSPPAIDPLLPRPPFPFLRLPLTVRDTIYTLLVLSPAPYPTTSPRTRRALRTNPHVPSAQTALFLVSRQIALESRTIFYTHNTFLIANGRWGCSFIPNLHGLLTFIDVVPEMFRKMIKKVEMRIVVPVGWLGTKLEGDDRDFEEVRMQEKMVGLGEVVRGELQGVEWVRVRFWNEGWDYARGDKPRCGWEAEIAVDREVCLLYSTFPYTLSFSCVSFSPLWRLRGDLKLTILCNRRSSTLFTALSTYHSSNISRSPIRVP